MFKNKRTKQQSVNVVDSLLSNYLQVSDKKVLKNKEKGKKVHVATKILEVNSKLDDFEKTKENLKKHKQKERKVRNKEMKKIEKINNRIIRQSKINKGDDKILNEIVKDKIKDLKKIDLVSKDEDLINLQNDIINLTNVKSTKMKLKDINDKKLLERKRKLENDQLFNKNSSNNKINFKTLTPGLAQPGNDSDDSDEDDDEEDDYDANNNGLSNFKDDFDDYN